MSLAPRSVALNVAGAQNWANFDRGIPRYIVEHVRALQATRPEIIESVLLDHSRPLSGNLSWLLDSGLLTLNQDERPVGRRAPASLPDIYHMMSPFELDTRLETMWPTWARDPSVATVVTVYDLIPLIFPDHYLAEASGRVEYRARAELIRHVDGVLAISQSTANDVVERLGVSPEKVHVIHAGATDIFGEMYASPEDAWRHLRSHLPRVAPGFILYVGGFEFRKNLETLIAGYARVADPVRARHQLVIACRMLPEQMENLRRHAHELGIRAGDLVLTGYVSDSDLGALYHACTLFAFPSLYEGSGLPILEAMACGAPVAASSTSTGPEILGDSEATFDPASAEAIAGCLEEVVTSPEALKRLRDRSRRRVADYTWQRVADASVRAYERVLGQRARRGRRRRRPRVALVTPWPPERSGVADYSLRLATELGRRVDVEIVVERPVDEYPPPQEEGVRLVSVRDFDTMRAVRQPDRILHCMGNSAFHGYIYDLLHHRRGAILFHDVRLTGFYGWYAGTERPEDPAGRLAEWIGALYGTRLPPEASSGIVPTWERQLALGIYMTRELQRYAEQCFVHSEMSRHVLELDRDPEDPVVPISVVPFGMPQVPRIPERARRKSERPLFISLGYVNEVKGIDVLIRAFALVATELPGARLVIAGPTDEAESRRWHAYAAAHAPEAEIEIPGQVDDARYAELLATADLAVQLRLISNGEASAAVADCLAVGLPTMVTDVGWLGALPSSAVSKVPVGVGAHQLATGMIALVRDRRQRSSISEHARSLAGNASFAHVAEAYLEALEL
jgi:glycosyltransferase involved in cell wall biosynthesis